MTQRRTRPPAPRFTIAALAGALPLASCAPDDAPTDHTPAYAATFEADGLRLEISLSHLDVTTTDRLILTLAATEGDAPDAPRLRGFALPTDTDASDTAPSTLGGFTILDAREHPPFTLTAGGVRVETDFKLEPFLPGAYTIPPIAALGATPSGGTVRVETEPITVRVRSLLDDDAPADISALRPPPEPTASPDLRWWALGALAAVAFGAGLVAARRKPRERSILGVSAERLRDLARGDSPVPSLDEGEQLLTLVVRTRTGAAPGARLIDAAPALHDPARSREARQLAETFDRLRFAQGEPAPDAARAALTRAADLAEALRAEDEAERRDREGGSS